MRDDFVGNIGDYGKYGLMRALTGVYPRQKSRLSLGIIWYRTDRERSQSGYLDYLGQEDEYEDCDRDLFSVMRLIDDNSRGLESIEASRILGPSLCDSPTTRLCVSSSLAPEHPRVRCPRSGA